MALLIIIVLLYLSLCFISGRYWHNASNHEPTDEDFQRNDQHIKQVLTHITTTGYPCYYCLLKNTTLEQINELIQVKQVELKQEQLLKKPR